MNRSFLNSLRFSAALRLRVKKTGAGLVEMCKCASVQTTSSQYQRQLVLILDIYTFSHLLTFTLAFYAGEKGCNALALTFTNSVKKHPEKGRNGGWHGLCNGKGAQSW